MKVASATLTGNNRSTIGGAIDSVVGLVDVVLVIDTGVTDDTLRVAAEHAGDKLVVRPFPWCDDFAAARNAYLKEATALGCDWVMPLDTDEWFAFNGEDVRSTLERATSGAIMMRDGTGTYSQARAIRLPTAERYAGRTHEAFPAFKVGVSDFDTARFHEHPKTSAQLEIKFARDRRILLEELKHDPDNSRWHFYLAETYRNLGRPMDAIAAYDACAELRGWAEESAWACYLAATCCCTLGQHRNALDRCARGLARHSGIAELAWLAGFCSFKVGAYQNAVGWSSMAVALGLFSGCGEQFKRIGFRHLPGLFEGPYDVMGWALKALGQPAEADDALRLYRDALAARLAYEKNRPGWLIPKGPAKPDGHIEQAD